MTDTHAGADAATSDRLVLIGTVVSFAMAALMIVAAVVARVTFLHWLGELAFWTQLLAGATMFLAVLLAAPLGLAVMRQRRRMVAEALEARRQVEHLFRMADMLQSALGYPDANAVLQATAAQLLPGFGGALYVFNNSRDRLDLSVAWDWPEASPPPDTVSPSHCWALKRGKAHMNESGARALRCEHHGPELVVLEIPMMARGEVYGLLSLQADGTDAEIRLASSQALAAAVADAMSLALSNIALREKLRTQALRDPLTGLYNRRYMEDMLERFANLAERNGSAVSAIMIDLDNFKRLNDEHGHAVGDAILREAAASIAGAMRPSDVACRYGGEELVVLLPDCTLDDAVAKAELLRARIESLSEAHGMRITASFGVAAMPETSVRVSDILASADNALYHAKQAGRNRVQAAGRRAEALGGTQLLAAAE